MKRAIPLLLLLSAVALVAAAWPAPTRYQVAPGSRFWIDGSSTAGRFSCAGAQVSGTGTVDEGSRRLNGHIAVPVRAFDCGRSRMNRDMQNALKSDRYPNITVTITGVEGVENATGRNTWVRVTAIGSIELAGVTRAVRIPARGRHTAPGRVEVSGQQALRMTDFGVDPPRGLMGLVRARDNVTARFEIAAVAQ